MKGIKSHRSPSTNMENYSSLIPSEKSKNRPGKRDVSQIINKENVYDFKEEDIDDIERLTNSTIMQHIGNGGFSTVKLIYNKCHNTYFAMKVVKQVLT